MGQSAGVEVRLLQGLHLGVPAGHADGDPQHQRPHRKPDHLWMPRLNPGQEADAWRRSTECLH